MGKNNQQRRAAKARERAAKARTHAQAHAQGQAHGQGGRGNRSPFAAGSFFADEPATPTIEERVTQHVIDGMRAIEREDLDRIEGAVAELAHLGADASERRVVTRTLTGLLDQRVAWLWRDGWQPADVHRMAGRAHGPTEQAILGDAIAHQLSQYAPSTIEPRWHDQLTDMSASTWWERDVDPVRARAWVLPGGTFAAISAVLNVLHLLQTLPRLERLDPLPGTAKPETEAHRAAREVDQRILTRVRLLLAKAESTPYEAEAETFTAGAQALMARHSIDVAMLAAAEGPVAGDEPSGRRIGIERPYEQSKALLLTAVADANRCRMVWSSSLGFATVVGFPADLQAVEAIFTSLLIQSVAAMTSEGRRVHVNGASRTRSFRNSFLTAFAHRIGQRLAEVTEEETQAATARAGVAGADPSASSAGGGSPAVSSRGREVVQILADRTEEVAAATDALFPDIRHTRSQTRYDREGWTAGVRAADNANLFTATGLAAGS